MRKAPALSRLGARLVARLSRAHAIALLFGLALLLLAPSLVLGANVSHSASFNHVWSTQVSAQMLAGEVYPRWLHGSYFSLGSPAFYFYPPLAFHLAAGVNALSGGTLAAPWQIALASLLLIAGSGAGMYAWLRDHLEPRWALVGAALYQAGPYHLIDHYVRGAFAEFAAFVFVPLVMLGLRRLARGGRPVLLLPLAYAGLILSHLPTALLVTTMLPLYALHLAIHETTTLQARARFLAAGVGLGVLGVALAGAYLLPAVSLTGAVSSERLWTGYYQVPRWFLVRPDRWPDPGFMIMLAALALGYATLAVGALLALRRNGGRETADRDAAFWCAAVLAGVVLMSGLVPLYWDAPLMAKVQFPWRLLVFLEFAAATAAALFLSQRSSATLGWWRRVGTALTVLAAAAAAGSAGSLMWTTVREGDARRADWSARLRDVNEYLPAGFFDTAPADLPDGVVPAYAYVDRRLAVLAARPLATVEGPGRATARQTTSGAVLVRVNAPAPVTVVVKRFHFPAWTVATAGAAAAPVRAHGPDRLVAFTAAPGDRLYRVSLRPLPIERRGWIVSTLAAALLVALALFIRRAPRPAEMSRV
jgi:hypothetical protein